MKYIFLSVLALSLFACSDKEPVTSVITKSTDGKRYTNAYFDIQVDKPEGWFAQDPEQTIKQGSQGARVVAGDDKNMKAILAESIKTTVPIFAFFKHEPGTPVKFNPSVIAVAENIEVMPGIKTGCDYLFHARSLLKNAAIELEVTDDCHTESINNAPLGYFDARISVNGADIYQKYYACIKNQHALSFIQTYFDDQSRSEVYQVISSLLLSCQ